MSDDLPVGTLREAVPHLRRPFTPEAVKFKVQSVFKGNSGCLVVAYIDARLASERLNRVIPDKWEPRYRPVDGKANLLWCDLSIDGVTHSDVGESPKGMSKDLVSDALKRAAVHFGVGVSIYALPQIRLFMKDSHGRIEVVGGDRKTVALTEHGHVKLREGYAKWLETFGVEKFGEPLDHGDVEGSTLNEEEPPVEDEFAPAPPPALEDEQAAELVKACRATYDAIKALGDEAAKEIPPGRFGAWLCGAQHSHAELLRLAEHLDTRLAQMTEKYGGGS